MGLVSYQAPESSMPYLRCSHCARELPVPGGVSRVECERCGGISHVAYRFDADVLFLAERAMGEDDLCESLERRLEILKSNLCSLDPLARWTRPPAITRASFHGPILLLIAAGCLGIVMRFESLIWPGLLATLGVFWAIRVLAWHQEISGIYERDALVSQRNLPVIEELLLKLQRYEALQQSLRREKRKGTAR